jgi:hypothetical protein
MEVRGSMFLVPQGLFFIENKEHLSSFRHPYPYMYPTKNHIHTPISEHSV